MRAEINEIKNRKNNRENWWHKKLAFWKDQESGQVLTGVTKKKNKRMFKLQKSEMKEETSLLML